MHWHIQRAAKESLRYISEHYSTVRNRKKDIWKCVCGCDECIYKDTHICTPTYMLLFWAACSTAVIQCLFLPTHFRLSYNSAGLRLQRGKNNELELIFTNFSQFEMRVQFVLGEWCGCSVVLADSFLRSFCSEGAGCSWECCCYGRIRLLCDSI